MRIAAITHVWKDDFFLKLWRDYYAAMLGPENCYVIFDGDDWDSAVDLTGLNVIREPGHLFHRLKNDARMAQAQSREMARLFETYDFVIRGDCDEFVRFDGEEAKSEIFETCRQYGAMLSIGLDVVQKTDQEAALDPDQPILKQRKHALIFRSYFKPNLLARHFHVRAGGHNLRDFSKFSIDKRLLMFHLGNIDEGLLAQRAAERSRNFQGHMQTRNELFGRVAAADVSADFDDLIDPLEGEQEGEAFFKSLKFSHGPVEVLRHTAHLVRIPDRYENVI